MRRHALVATATLLVGVLAGRAWGESQPLMQNALASLNTAIGYLERAEHDKGGHRTKALELARQARDEVKAGIGFADTH